MKDGNHMSNSGSQRPPVNAHQDQISNIFSEKYYFEIPRFQRSYSWDIEQISDFWEDITHAEKRGKSHVHFLGAMVFARHPINPSLYVLDGQQRLTTLMLLTIAMRDLLIGIEDSDAKELLSMIDASLKVTVKLETGMRRVSRLKANDQDRKCYEDILESGRPSMIQHESHRLIKKAYDYFYSELQKLSDDDRKRYEYYSNLWASMTDQFWYIHIICEEEINAQVVFEALNAKGEDLSSADLMKNYLLMQIAQKFGEDEAIDANNKWSTIISKLGKDSMMPDFLHTFWQSKYSYVRADEVYEDMKKRVSDQNLNAENLLNDLLSEAEVFAETRNPSNNFWGNVATARMLRELKILNIKIVDILMLSVYSIHRDDPNVVEKCLRRILNFMVRYSKVCEKASNTIAKSFSEIACELRKGIKTVDDLEEWLRVNAPSNDEFISSFKALKVKSGPTARYILMKINNAMNTDQEPEAMVADPEQVTLEHIIPQVLNEDWSKVLQEDDVLHDDVLNRIGNLTLLTGKKNTSASNRNFEIKRDEIYADSSLPINKDLVLSVSRNEQGFIDLDLTREQLKQFGLKELVLRQERMALLANEIWEINQ